MDSLFVDLIHLCRQYIYLFIIWHCIYILEFRHTFSTYTLFRFKLSFFSQENDAASIPGKGRKRAAPRGRGRGSAQSSKRGRKSDNTTIQRMLMSKDDDDDDDDVVKRLNKPQPRVGFTFSFWFSFICKIFNWIYIHQCAIWMLLFFWGWKSSSFNKIK